MAKGMKKLRSCIVIVAILMCVVSGTVFAVDSGDNAAKASNRLDGLEEKFTGNNSTERGITVFTNNTIGESRAATNARDGNTSGDGVGILDANLSMVYLNATQDSVVSREDSGNDIILPDISNATHEHVSVTSCTVSVAIDDDTCVGYEVYIDGVYQFTEGQGTTPDGFCSFSVTEGTHTLEIRKNGCSASKTHNFLCGSYTWVSMPDYWCEDGGGDCDNPPTVNFDKTSYYEGDTVQITVSTIHSSAYYEIKDCSGTVRETGYTSGGTISYTIPSGASECCYWTICFYWDEGDDPTPTYNPTLPLGLQEVAGNVNAESYQCTNCDSRFYVCPQRDTPTPPTCDNPPTAQFDKPTYCEGDTVHATVSAPYMKNRLITYEIKDCSDKLKFSGNTIDGSKIEYQIPKGMSSSCCDWSICFSWKVLWEEKLYQCGPVCYDFEVCPETCEAYVIIDDRVCAGYEVYVNGKYQLTDGKGETLDGYCTFTVPEGDYTIEIRKDGCSEIVFNYQYFQCNEHYYKIPDTDWCYCDKPDLIIHNLSWSPANPKEGDEIRFTVKTKNIGGGDANEGFYIYYYIAGDRKDSDYVSGGLDAGETRTDYFNWTVDMCGEIKVKAVADATNAVDEGSNEGGDNEWIETLNIPCEKPDLIISDISMDPEEPKVGDEVTFVATVKNIGEGIAEESSFLAIVLNFDAKNKRLFKIADTCPSLKPGESHTYTKKAKIENCGAYLFLAGADTEREIDERKEENNGDSISFTVSCPNLKSIWIKGLDKIKAGERKQWQAYGLYSDGSQNELPHQVSWTVDAPEILQNMGTGKFKGLKGGDATIKITYEGKSASKKVTVIEKKNQPPKASFTYEKDGLTVRFTSTSSDPDGEIKEYLWVFLEDAGMSTQRISKPEHTYLHAGKYEVILFVWDDKGAVAAHSEGITVQKKIPIEKGEIKFIGTYLYRCVPLMDFQGYVFSIDEVLAGENLAGNAIIVYVDTGPKYKDELPFFVPTLLNLTKGDKVVIYARAETKLEELWNLKLPSDKYYIHKYRDHSAYINYLSGVSPFYGNISEYILNPVYWDVLTREEAIKGLEELVKDLGVNIGSDLVDMSIIHLWPGATKVVGSKNVIILPLTLSSFIIKSMVRHKKIDTYEGIGSAINLSDSGQLRVLLFTLQNNGEYLKTVINEENSYSKAALELRQGTILSAYEELCSFDQRFLNNLRDTTITNKASQYDFAQKYVAMLANELIVDYALTTIELNHLTGENEEVFLPKVSECELQSHCFQQEDYLSNCFGYFNSKGDTDKYEITISPDVSLRIYPVSQRHLKATYILKQAGKEIARGSNSDGLRVSSPSPSGIYELDVKSDEGAGCYGFDIHVVNIKPIE